MNSDLIEKARGLLAAQYAGNEVMRANVRNGRYDDAPYFAAIVSALTELDEVRGLCAEEAENNAALRIKTFNLEEELEALRAVCACAYQLAGYHAAPVEWLDILCDAATGVPFERWRQQGDPIDVLLPYAPSYSPSASQKENSNE